MEREAPNSFHQTAAFELKEATETDEEQEQDQDHQQDPIDEQTDDFDTLLASNAALDSNHHHHELEQLEQLEQEEEEEEEMKYYQNQHNLSSTGNQSQTTQSDQLEQEDDEDNAGTGAFEEFIVDGVDLANANIDMLEKALADNLEWEGTLRPSQLSESGAIRLDEDEQKDKEDEEEINRELMQIQLGGKFRAPLNKLVASNRQFQDDRGLVSSSISSASATSSIAVSTHLNDPPLSPITCASPMSSDQHTDSNVISEFSLSHIPAQSMNPLDSFSSSPLPSDRPNLSRPTSHQSASSAKSHSSARANVFQPDSVSASSSMDMAVIAALSAGLQPMNSDRSQHRPEEESNRGVIDEEDENEKKEEFIRFEAVLDSASATASPILVSKRLNSKRRRARTRGVDEIERDQEVNRGHETDRSINSRQSPTHSSSLIPETSSIYEQAQVRVTAVVPVQSTRSRSANTSSSSSSSSSASATPPQAAVHSSVEPSNSPLSPRDELRRKISREISEQGVPLASPRAHSNSTQSNSNVGESSASLSSSSVIRKTGAVQPEKLKHIKRISKAFAAGASLRIRTGNMNGTSNHHIAPHSAAPGNESGSRLHPHEVASANPSFQLSSPKSAVVNPSCSTTTNTSPFQQSRSTVPTKSKALSPPPPAPSVIIPNASSPSAFYSSTPTPRQSTKSSPVISSSSSSSSSSFFSSPPSASSLSTLLERVQEAVHETIMSPKHQVNSRKNVNAQAIVANLEAMCSPKSQQRQTPTAKQQKQQSSISSEKGSDGKKKFSYQVDTKLSTPKQQNPQSSPSSAPVAQQPNSSSPRRIVAPSALHVTSPTTPSSATAASGGPRSASITPSPSKIPIRKSKIAAGQISTPTVYSMLRTNNNATPSPASASGTTSQSPASTSSSSSSSSSSHLTPHFASPSYNVNTSKSRSKSTTNMTVVAPSPSPSIREDENDHVDSTTTTASGGIIPPSRTFTFSPTSVTVRRHEQDELRASDTSSVSSNASTTSSQSPSVISPPENQPQFRQQQQHLLQQQRELAQTHSHSQFQSPSASISQSRSIANRPHSESSSSSFPDESASQLVRASSASRVTAAHRLRRLRSVTEQKREQHSQQVSPRQQQSYQMDQTKTMTESKTARGEANDKWDERDRQLQVKNWTASSPRREKGAVLSPPAPHHSQPDSPTQDQYESIPVSTPPSSSRFAFHSPSALPPPPPYASRSDFSSPTHPTHPTHRSDVSTSPSLSPSPSPPPYPSTSGVHQLRHRAGSTGSLLAGKEKRERRRATMGPGMVTGVGVGAGMVIREEEIETQLDHSNSMMNSHGSNNHSRGNSTDSSIATYSTSSSSSSNNNSNGVSRNDRVRRGLRSQSSHEHLPPAHLTIVSPESAIHTVADGGIAEESAEMEAKALAASMARRSAQLSRARQHSNGATTPNASSSSGLSLVSPSSSRISASGRRQNNHSFFNTTDATASEATQTSTILQQARQRLIQQTHSIPSTSPPNSTFSVGNANSPSFSAISPLSRIVEGSRAGGTGAATASRLPTYVGVSLLPAASVSNRAYSDGMVGLAGAAPVNSRYHPTPHLHR